MNDKTEGALVERLRRDIDEARDDWMPDEKCPWLEVSVDELDVLLATIERQAFDLESAEARIGGLNCELQGAEARLERLRGALEELVNKRETVYAEHTRHLRPEWRDGSDGRYARARKALADTQGET